MTEATALAVVRPSLRRWWHLRQHGMALKHIHLFINGREQPSPMAENVNGNCLVHFRTGLWIGLRLWFQPHRPLDATLVTDWDNVGANWPCQDTR
jgi:hypothetical protein